MPDAPAVAVVPVDAMSAWSDPAFADDCWRRLTRVAGRIVHNHQLAEDICQEVLFGFWSRPEAFDPTRGTILGYLTVLCRSRARDAVRSEEARRRREEQCHHSSRTSAPRDPADVLPDERLLAALTKLSPAEVVSLKLAIYGDLTYRQVADVLGIPEGTAKTRIRQALRKARAALEG